MTTRDALKVAELTLDGLEILKGLAPVGSAIARVVETLLDGAHGKASPQAVAGELDELRTAIAANDAAALESLKKKWGRDQSR